MSGRLIAVVGPSGVGKDTLIQALVAARPDLYEVRRAITRPTDQTESCISLSEAEFARQREAGGFALSWRAHGLSYGVPIEALRRVREGQDAIANLSRGMLGAAMMTFPDVLVLSLTATPEVLAARLGARGRETREDVARRMARAAPRLPQGARVVEIDNGGSLESAFAVALGAILKQSAT